MAVVMIPPQVLLGLPNSWAEPQGMNGGLVGPASGLVVSQVGKPAATQLLFTGSGSDGYYVEAPNGPLTLSAPNGEGGMVQPWVMGINAANVTVGATPASSTPTIASGTVYQNTTGRYVSYDVSCYATTAGTSGTIAFARGATSTPTAVFTDYVSGSTSSTATVSRHLFIPPGWYWSVTLTGATLGTVTEVEA
jgi:hypothetical protein